MKEMNTLPKRIAVLMGGPGSERDVSLATARGVAKALRSRGLEVFEVDVRDENFELPQDIDLAFITIHGTFGEDGTIQGLLEMAAVPFVGCGTLALKVMAALADAGVDLPRFRGVRLSLSSS